ncbi:MAG: FAD-dependent oxidoreductase [Alloprevotella sp.]
MKACLVISLLALAAGVLTLAAHGRPWLRRSLPVRLWTTAVTLTVFFFGTFLLLLPFSLLCRLPLGPAPSRRRAFHTLFSRATRFLLFVIPGTPLRVSGLTSETFSRARVVVANHTSLLDALCLIALTPRLIFLTKDWVWRNPFLGLLVRGADFLPVSAGLDANMSRLSRLVAEGYSVLVFPEGTRSADGRPHRFHQGAFHLSARLGLEVLPVSLSGHFEVLSRHAWMLTPGPLSVNIGCALPPPPSVTFDAVSALRRRVAALYAPSEVSKPAGPPSPSVAAPSPSTASGRRCVIIGSGLGGLACGNILSRMGYDVTVLEQGRQAGGCLQSFKRGDAVFETGMHYLGALGSGGNLRRLFDMLDVSHRLTFRRLDPEAYDVLRLGGEQYEYAAGRQAFFEGLLHRFPTEGETLSRYMAAIDEVSRLSDVGQAISQTTITQVLSSWQSVGMYDALAAMSPRSAELAAVLAGRLPLIAATRSRTPFSLHAFITGFYMDGGWRVVGGSHHIAQALISRLTSAGGKVLTRRRATAITASDGRVTGVTTADGSHFPADYVISDAHPSVTLSLLPEGAVRPVFRRRLLSLPQTTGCFTVYLRFKPGRMPYMNRNYFCYAGPTPWDCERYEGIGDWPKGYFYMHTCQSADGRWAHGGVVVSYMKWDEMLPWLHTLSGRRGPAYEDFKRRRAELLLSALERDLPGTLSCVERYYTSTPLTWRDYTGTCRGSMYGTAADFATGAAGRVPVRLKLGGLYQTGQNVNSHGMLGTLVGALQTIACLPGGADYLAGLLGKSGKE